MIFVFFSDCYMFQRYIYFKQPNIKWLNTDLIHVLENSLDIIRFVREIVVSFVTRLWNCSPHFNKYIFLCEQNQNGKSHSRQQQYNNQLDYKK